jgi:class 3 adenylate cyclase/tetratricopeptide (TPR) repeat protein
MRASRREDRRRQCPRCRAANREGRRFCRECGLSFASTCPACGFLNEGHEKFCGGCGRPRAALPGPAETRFQSPQAYTPTHLAGKIMDARSALEGERKQVTVLFADLKGSMELLADRDPEEARSLLDPVLERMMEAVHRYEGTVNQVMGDGIMALFGAPVAHEDHAVRACYAALRMQELVRDYAERAFRTLGVTVRIRVGLNSGDVVVRSIRSDLRMDYTAVGQTTHLAARMEQLAPPGAIWMAAPTLRLADAFVEVRPLGPVPVQGLDAPVEVYELLAAGPVRTRFQASVVRGLSRFVGREAELEQLQAAVEAARHGRGGVVAVVGEPGVGKSRLFHELARSPGIAGCRVLHASAVSHGLAVGYLPVVQLLKAYFRVDERDDVRSIRAKVTGHVLTLDEGLRGVLAPILWLLDALPEDDGLRDLEPPRRRQLTLDAVSQLFLRESQVQPLVLVMEDLHWVDAETHAVLDGVVASVPAASVLLLVNYRPEYRDRWSGQTCHRHLRIDPLPPAGSEALLQALVGDGAELAPLTRLLIERTEGNPLFLEESVRTLVEVGALAGERGAYRLIEDPRAIRVPATVQALLAERIDRLSPADKRLLQAAAAIGKEVPYRLLRATVEEDEGDLGRGLARLVAGDFLDEARLHPEREYTFKHALTLDVAYASLVQERRRALHLRILEALERRPADQPGEEVEHVARHALGAEAWDRAARYLRQAGRRAITRSSYAAAVELLRQALGALERLPDTQDTLESAIDARLELRVALVALGHYHDALAVMRQAETLATRLGDRPRLGRVLADICARLRNVTGEHQRAIEVGERALAIAAESGDRALELEARYRTGQAYFAIGDHRRALDHLSGAVQVAAEAPRPVSPLFASWSRTWLALTLASVGRFAESRSRAREALTVAEGADHPFTLAEALTGVGSVALAQGHVDEAVAVLQRAHALVSGWDHQPSTVMARLGYALALSGRARAGRELLETATASATTMSSMGVGRALQLAWLGEAHLLEGRVEDARRRAQEALALARRHQERGHEAWALHLLGAVEAGGRASDLGEAQGGYRAALTLADELGMRPLMAHCHLGLGTLLRRMDRPEWAREHLAMAATLYREMDMRGGQDRVDAEMRRPA